MKYISGEFLAAFLTGRHRQLAVAASIVVFILIIGDGALANVNEFDAKLNYKSHFVPSLEIAKFPGGISAIKQNSYLFKLKSIDRNLNVEVPFEHDYVNLTLYAGKYALYHPLVMPRQQYIRYSAHRYEVQSWVDDMASFSGTKGKGQGNEGIEMSFPVHIPESVTSIIGEGAPRINVSGSRKIAFSGRSQWDDIPQTGTFKQSKFPSLHMEQTSRFKIKGTIGSKISIEVDQDSNRDVDIANTLRLRYTGGEDEIIQSIEAGNTNLSLPNSQFIGFSQSVQGLFGIKATAKIGKVELTMITSQEKGSNEKSTFSSGTQASADTIWDYRYLHNVYFYLGDNFTANDQLIDLKLFKNGTEQDLYGLACVNPVSGDGSDGGVDTVFNVIPEEETRNEVERRYFKIIEENIDYTFYNSGWYVILNQQLGEDEALAAYIKYVRHYNDGSVDTLQEGKVVGDTLVLKLIRDPNTDPSFATWDLEWKNVYDLLSRDISPDGFELDIYKGIGDMTTDTLGQGNTRFITLFGFDQYNNSNPSDETPDGVFDFNTSRPDIDPARGHLIFHQREPFADSSLLNDPNPAVYSYKYNNQDRTEAKKYYIYVKTATRANTFSLGKTNIIENSEVVKLGDGRILNRGVDYNIIYEIGQITFLNEEALNAASEISVDFEYSPFFMPEKKSLFGLSAVYKINDKSMFSLAGMYRNESTREFRPRVGREPKRSMIWDSNMILHFDPQFLTDAVDALPFIETDTPSALELSGEVAQSFPNPNLRNNAFIDDFEGSRQSTDLIMRRGIWTKSSPPAGRTPEEYRPMWWYNPYDPILITDIWPDKDVQQHENRQDVLFLEYHPDTTEGPDFEGWGGIMRSMYSGLADQSRTKFIEIWYKPDTLSSEYPVLHIDTGDMSEDLNGDNYKNTEDRNGNGVFEENEDTGLDTLTNAQERVVFNMPNVEDPSGDDWYYSNVGNERYDYSRINGTEGNRQDPDRLSRIDTEDINNNGSLDLSNSYYEFSIDLRDSPFIQDSTRSGWKLVRIPFQDSTAYEAVGNPDRQNINFIRIWIDGVDHRYLLKLASVEFVGNKWQELSLPDPIYMNGIPRVPAFEVTVKNTQENATTYTSPPGVYGEYDQETGVQEKEQSLVLRYEDLLPGQRLGTYWTLLQPEDYTLYNRLKMYVHGDENLDEDLPVYFYFKMGLDSTSNFYQFRTKLYPGWDGRNYVDIDFTRMTGLKAYRDPEQPDSMLMIDGNYSVKGNPSLSLVKMFVIGIEYDSLMIDTTFADNDSIVSIDTTEVPLLPISGETWCDELVLTDVRRKSDFAGRFTGSLKLADLANVTVNYSRTGADFFRLTAKKPEGSLSTQQSISSSVNLDKLFPPSWGLNLPLSANWQKTLLLPRLKTGSDIILPYDLRQLEKTENRSWQVSISESFRKNTGGWLFNWTLNRIQTRYVYSKKYGTSPTNPVNNATNYEASGKYDLTPRSKPFLKPFFWLKYMFLPKSIYDIRMFYLPTALKYDASVASTRSYTVTRGTSRSIYTRDFSGTQTYGLSLFSELKADFSSTTNRDISDPKLLNFSFNPDEILLGRERTYGQNFNLSFSPKLSRLLMPRVTFNSRYNDNSDLTTNSDSTHTTRQSSTIRGDISLDVFSLLGLNKLLGGGQSGNRYVPNMPEKERKDEKRREEMEKQSDEGKGEGQGEGEIDEGGEKGEGEIGEEGEGEGEEKKDKFKIPNPLTPIKKSLAVFGILTTLKPVKATVSSDKQLDRAGMYSRPGWMYTLGFVDQTDVRRKEDTNYIRDKITRTLDYSFQSGLTPLSNIDLNTSYKFRESTSKNSNSTVGTQTRSVEFPRVDGTLSGLEKLPFFKAAMQTVRLQSTYAKKIDESGEPETGELNNRSTSESFSPLVGLNFILKKGVKIDLRYERNKKKTEDLRLEGSNGRVDYDEDQGFRVTISYSVTSPQGIKLPIFGRLKLSSQLTMSLDIDKRYRKSSFVINGDKSIDANSEDISIEPRLVYRFSAKVTGGLNAKWADSNDKLQQRKRHIRELGIWTELRF